MRSSILLLACLLTCGTAAAQLNQFFIYPEESGSSATFASRPAAGAAAEGLIEVSNRDFRGVGENSAGCVILGFRHWAIDEDLSTAETYGIVYRKANATNDGPDVTAAGVLLSIQNLTTPTNPSGGRGSWNIVDTFMTPLQLTCGDSFFQGVDFPVAPNWNMDGHSLWSAFTNPPASRGVGENPRIGYPRDIAWANDLTGTPNMLNRTYILGSLVASPVLQIGGVDPNSCLNGPTRCGTPNYGLGGLFPDMNPGRQDGLTVRIKTGPVAAGTAFLLLSTGFTPFPPISIPGIDGALYLDPTLLFPLGGVPLAGNNTEVTILPPNVPRRNLVGRNFALQAVVIDTMANAAFTNGQATHL